jgi:hypothetical protein
VAFDDTFADRESDARSGYFTAGVQTLIDLEYPFLVFRGVTDTGVRDGKLDLGLKMFRGHLDMRRHVRPGILYGVSDAVWEKLAHRTRGGEYVRQRTDVDNGLRFFYDDLQVGESLSKRVFGGYRRKRMARVSTRE